MFTFARIYINVEINKFAPTFIIPYDNTHT